MTTSFDSHLAHQQDRVDAEGERRQDEAPDVPLIVASVDAALRQHRRFGYFECTPCDPEHPWDGPTTQHHEEHQGLDLYRAGLLAERPMPTRDAVVAALKDAMTPDGHGIGFWTDSLPDLANTLLDLFTTQPAADRGHREDQP
jgi:hypothetical protein